MDAEGPDKVRARRGTCARARHARLGRGGDSECGWCSFHIPGVGLFRVNLFRLLWRSFYVVLTTLLAALLPVRPLLARRQMPPQAQAPSSSTSTNCHPRWRCEAGLTWRCVLQFFNDIVGLLGAIGFWPLTIFFPTQVSPLACWAQKGTH